MHARVDGCETQVMRERKMCGLHAKLKQPNSLCRKGYLLEKNMEVLMAANV